MLKEDRRAVRLKVPGLVANVKKFSSLQVQFANTGTTLEERTTEKCIIGCVSSHLSERFHLAFSTQSYCGELFGNIGLEGGTAASKRS